MTWTGRPDYRRFTVVEGETPLLLPEVSPAGEELWEHGEEEREERWKWDEEEKSAELQRLCQRCHIVTSQLRRQAVALTGRSSLQHSSASAARRPIAGGAWSLGSGAALTSHQHFPAALRVDEDPAYASFLLEELQHLQWPGGGDHHQPLDTRCPVCSASFHQLRRRALRQALGVNRKVAPQTDRRASGPLAGAAGVDHQVTVTLLPCKNPLEGLWRVTTESDGVYVTVTSSTPDNKPPVHDIATQTSWPPSAAVSFFSRAAQVLTPSRRRRRGRNPPGSTPPLGPVSRPTPYTGGFAGALRLSIPPLPPCLLRGRSKVKPGLGKVRVMVRICSESPESSSLLRVDSRGKQLTICQSNRGSTPCPTASPKTFQFDAVFTHDASQVEVCSAAAAEVIQSVVNGSDGCIFCYGHAHLGKSYTLIGRDCSTQSLGVAPTAICWLFRVMEQRVERSGGCFSISVSAVEVSGHNEKLRDLLAAMPTSSPRGQQPVTLLEDPVCGSQLQNQTQLQAASAEQAAAFLDTALAARTTTNQESRRNSHFLFTLHLHQERPGKNNKAAGWRQSCLNLLDLGSCDSDLSGCSQADGAQRCLSLSALGNVILALANGANSVPFRNRKLTRLLCGSLGNINCHTTMIFHVSDSTSSYMETLTTMQLASRIHRTRNKSKCASSSSGGESSCEDSVPRRSPALRRPLSHPFSNGKHPADTLIYVGPNQERSDIEAPPPFVPIIPSLNRKCTKDEHDSSDCGNHFKCNTFAELQEKLDCVDGGQCADVNWTETELLSHDLGHYPHNSSSTASVPAASTGRTEKVLASPASSVAAATEHSGLLGRLCPLDPLRTTVTLQRPVQLNKEDELVFTLVAELPSSRMTDSSSFSRGQSLPTITSGWQPVSIISSINDEYESFMSLPSYQEPETSLTQASRSHHEDNSGPIKMLEVPQASQLSSPLRTTTTSPHHHLLLQREGDDLSRVEDSISARKSSLGQVTFRRPAEDHRSSSTVPLNLQEPSSVVGCNQGDSLIKPTVTLGNLWCTEEPSGSTRSSNLRKKANLLRDLTFSKKSSLDQNSRTALPKRASRTSQDVSRTSVTEKDLQRQSSRGHTPTGQGSSNSRSPLRADIAKQQPSRPQSINSTKEKSGGRTSKFNVTSTTTSPYTGSNYPPEGLGSSPNGDRKSNTGTGTFPGTKFAFSRRLLQLASVSRGKQQGERSHQPGTGSAGDTATMTPPLHPPSPYSKMTAPRRRHNSSSSGCSSSVLSGNLLPSMGHTTLLPHKGGASSSGYGSSTATNDSESTASSVHKTPSERGLNSSTQGRAFRLPRKRGNGSQRRNLIRSPFTSLVLGGEGSSTHCGGKETFEVTVYEIDHVEQRKQEEEQVQQGLQYLDIQLRVLQRRQQQVAKLQLQHQQLQVELQEVRALMTIKTTRGSDKFSVDQELELDQDQVQGSKEYLEALAKASAELQDYIILCKSCIMMETCFDITDQQVEQLSREPSIALH